MMKLAHIVNPVHADATSDLGIAQPITFETMRRARDYASGEVEVVLYATQFAEDHPAVPSDFTTTPDLDRSVLDVGVFRRSHKLPLLKDILDRLYGATDADYLIYTNADIGLQPHFYVTVERLLEAGYDAFVINRRTIDARFDRVEQIPLMYASLGTSHPGWDCFVFRRSAFQKYDLGRVCIGAPRCGLALLANLQVHANRFAEFRKLHLTFHRGDDRAWSDSSAADSAAFNTREVVGLLRRLEEQHGKFDRKTPPGRFLFRRRFLGPLYEGWVRWANARRRRSGE